MVAGDEYQNGENADVDFRLTPTDQHTGAPESADRVVSVTPGCEDHYYSNGDPGDSDPAHPSLRLDNCLVSKGFVHSGETFTWDILLDTMFQGLGGFSPEANLGAILMTGSAATEINARYGIPVGANFSLTTPVTAPFTDIPYHVRDNGAKGTALLQVQVNGPGTLTMSGTAYRKKKSIGGTVVPVSIPVSGPGLVQIPYTVRGHALKVLKKTGSIGVRGPVTFTRADGATYFSPTSLTLYKRVSKRHN